MRQGEVALWHRGTIVWQGSVGATINGVDFDAVSINIEDGERLTKLTGRKAGDGLQLPFPTLVSIGTFLRVELSVPRFR